MAFVKRIAHQITFTHTGTGAFSNIRSVTAYSPSRDEVDMTVHADDVEDIQQSPILRLGEVTITVLWDRVSTEFIALEDLCTAPPASPPASEEFVIGYPAGFTALTTHTFNGWVKSLGPINHEIGGEITRDITIQVTSIPVDSI